MIFWKINFFLLLLYALRWLTNFCKECGIFKRRRTKMWSDFCKHRLATNKFKKNITRCHFLQTCQKSYLTISFEEQENKVTKLIYKFVAGILTSLKCYRSAKTFIQVTKPKWVIYLVCLGRLFYKHFMHTKIITPSSLCYTRSENTCPNLCAKRRLPKHYHKHNIITGP